MPRITRKKSAVDLEAKENVKIRQTRKTRRTVDESSDEDGVSPAKSSRSESSSLSPIVEQINKVKISTEKSQFRSARRALVQNNNHSLPGREKEWDELVEYLEDHILGEKSGSLYLSGAPGTGKTATLMKLVNTEHYSSRLKIGFVNCTSVSSIGAIYKKICAELNIKVSASPSERESLEAIENYLTKKHKTTLLVLDEIDQLCGTGKKQNDILYHIFEWPSIKNSKLILVGIANSLDLTDRALTRLQMNVQLKPTVMHFAAYTKAQIFDIFKTRLEESGTDLFPPAAITLLAAKVSAVSGDIRRALNIGKRVIEIAELERSKNSRGKLDITKLEAVIESETDETEKKPMKIEMREVVTVLNNVYGNSQKLADDVDEAFPLLQKILLCTLMLIVKHDKRKVITVGHLNDIYKKVCKNRNINAIDFCEFMGICNLVETKGIIKIVKKKEPRFHHVQLQWDEDEIISQLKDKQMIENILSEKALLR